MFNITKMSKVLHKARILSSEKNSSCKQEQKTNVSIKIKPSSNVNYPNIPISSNFKSTL